MLKNNQMKYLSIAYKTYCSILVIQLYVYNTLKA